MALFSLLVSKRQQEKALLRAFVHCPSSGELVTVLVLVYLYLDCSPEKQGGESDLITTSRVLS